MKPKKRPLPRPAKRTSERIPIRIPNRRFRQRRPPARRLRKRSSSNPLPHIPPRPPRLPGAEAKDDAFVAAVPDGLDIEERRDLTVERLPGDESLSDEEIESALYDPTLDLSSYQRPPIELLEDHSVEVSVTSEEIVENKNRIKETLENFGIKIDKIKATVGRRSRCMRSYRLPAFVFRKSRTSRTISRRVSPRSASGSSRRSRARERSASKCRTKTRRSSRCTRSSNR